MKILQLTPEYPPQYCGGVGNSVHEVVNNMQELGHDVEVIAPRGYNSKGKSKSGVHHIFAAKIIRDWGELAICPTILSEIKKIDFEIAHAHTPQKFFAESICLFDLLSKRKKPYVVSIRLINQSLPPLLSGSSHVYRKLIEKKIFKRASRMVVQSEANRDFIISNCGVFPSKIEIIPNGVDTSFFDSNLIGDNRFISDQKDWTTILFAGRLTSQKGLDVLLRAFAEIIQKHRDLKLLVAGDGALKTDLESLCRTLGLQQNVDFLGAISRAEMPKLYKAADIFVLPSISESFPNSLLEAMAMEKPIIATRVGAVPEIIQDGKEALLVSPGDQKSLARAIERLVSDDGLDKRLSRNAKILVKKKYTWESVTQKTLKIYEDILR